MVILTKDFDGFGNQLLLASHFIANAAEYGYDLVMPNFAPYAHYFEGTAREDFNGLPISLRPSPWDITRLTHRWLQTRRGYDILSRLPWVQHRLGLQLLGDEGDEGQNLNDPAYLAKARNGRLLIHGWLFRDKEHFAKHGPLLRRIFRPVAQHQQAVERVLTTNRAHADVLVGVHIRRGDYAGWLGGALLYDNATYARAMRETRAQFPAHTRVRFLLFSNEPIPAADFAGFDFGTSTNHPVEDLYAMAGCDYIIGPLSTYSMWASFYGEVPLFHLHRPNQAVPALSDFVVFKDQKTNQWEMSLA